jgi:hypothetical protein
MSDSKGCGVYTMVFAYFLSLDIIIPIFNVTETTRGFNEETCRKLLVLSLLEGNLTRLDPKEL